MANPRARIVVVAQRRPPRPGPAVGLLGKVLGLAEVPGHGIGASDRTRPGRVVNVVKSRSRLGSMRFPHPASRGTYQSLTRATPTRGCMRVANRHERALRLGELRPRARRSRRSHTRRGAGPRIRPPAPTAEPPALAVAGSAHPADRRRRELLPRLPLTASASETGWVVARAQSHVGACVTSPRTTRVARQDLGRDERGRTHSRAVERADMPSAARRAKTLS